MQALGQFFLSDNGITDLLMVAGIGLFALVLMMQLQKYRAGRKDAPPPLAPEEQLERRRQMRGLERDLDRLMTEIQEMSTRVGTQMDARSQQLEQLIRQADQRLEQLRAAAADKQVGAAQPPAPAQPVETRSPGLEKKDLLPTTAALPTDPLARLVYQLADQGLDAAAIAAKTREHIGKVELILALRQA